MRLIQLSAEFIRLPDGAASADVTRVPLTHPTDSILFPYSAASAQYK